MFNMLSTDAIALYALIAYVASLLALLGIAVRCKLETDHLVGGTSVLLIYVSGLLAVFGFAYMG